MYKAYIKDIRNLKSPINPLLLSDSNILNLRPIPEDLPPLTGVKEIIIARVYIYLQVVYVYSQQRQYTGYICYFGQNTPKT